MNLADEITETIKLLERQIPVNPAANEHIEKELRKSLSEYFKGLENALDWNKLEQLFYHHAGLVESIKPPKPEIIIEEAVIKGDKGDKGDTGERGEQGERGESGKQGEQGEQGERGFPGTTGEKGGRGEQGIQGEHGERGLTGKQGIQGEKGDKGDTGDPGLSKAELKKLETLVKDSKDFVRDDDPRLKDDREPKTHKHPEIQPLFVSYPIMNVGGVSGGIQSEPPEGYFEVSNIYYDPTSGKMVVVYKSE